MLVKKRDIAKVRRNALSGVVLGPQNKDRVGPVSYTHLFLTAFEAGALEADLDNGTSTGTTDNAVDINDLLYFLVRFEAGC